ncbi:hypothetical protein P7C73_g887, partial [Tremellales sp. Uapishka_1]
MSCAVGSSGDHHNDQPSVPSAVAEMNARLGYSITGPKIPNPDFGITTYKQPFWDRMEEIDDCADLLETDAAVEAFELYTREAVARRQREPTDPRPPPTVTDHAVEALKHDIRDTLARREREATASRHAPRLSANDPTLSPELADPTELVDDLLDNPLHMPGHVVTQALPPSGRDCPPHLFLLGQSSPLLFHPSEIGDCSTPHQAPCSPVPTPPRVETPRLPDPSDMQSTAPRLALRPTSTALDTPPHVPSPTASTGVGRGHRDDPATPVFLGTPKFLKLKRRNEYQTLTDHFVNFQKTVNKPEAPVATSSKGRPKKAVALGKASSKAALGGTIFSGLRICVPPELGQTTKDKQRWDVIHKLGGKVVLQPDTAITHVIHDSGRSASSLAKELGLQSLTELPTGTVCVKWEWVVRCKLSAKLVDTTPFLSFRKNVFASMENGSKKGRLQDITEQLRGSSTSIRKKRQITASDSETESSKHTVPMANPKVKQPRQSSPLKHAHPTNATTHELPTGPGWKVATGATDGLDLMITGLMEGTVDEQEELGEEAEKADYTGFKCQQANDGSAKEGPNEWLAAQFDNLHDVYKGVPGKNSFSVLQYSRAAAILRRSTVRITKGGQAQTIKGIGAGMAARIDEFLEGGQGRAYYENTERMQSIQVFKDVYGIGKAHANEIYDRGARTIEDLRSKDFGLNHNQIIGVELYEDLRARIPRDECKEIYENIRNEAHKEDPKLWIEIMGSYRRGSESSGDVDILITRDTSDGLDHTNVLSRLVTNLKMRGVITHDLSTPHDWRALEAKWMGVGKASPSGKYRRIGGSAVLGLRSDKTQAEPLDILCIPFDQWGAALIYFTGNDIFNRSLRLYARKQGYSLNQRGLYAGVIRGKDGLKITEGHIVASKSEQDIFDVLGIRWRDPQQRRP